MFKKKYLLLELDPFEAEFYHLPEFVPYFEKDQKSFDREGFDWDLALKAMRNLVNEEDCSEYKLYKLFTRKWSLYQKLTESTKNENWTEAENTIERILAIDLLDPSAYLNLGLIARSQGDFQKSIQSFHKGLELVKYKSPFLAGLAKTFEALGNFEDAIYYWNEIIEESNKDLEETLNNEILVTAYKEAVTKLIEKQVYKFKISPETQNSSIEFARSSKTSQAIYEMENIPKLFTKDSKLSQELEPDYYYETLMRKIFQKHFNDKEALTKLGVKLVHHKLTKLAVRVLERVYQLSESENQVLVKS